MNTVTKTKALLEAALEYSRRGWSVMPVARGAKLPLDKWKKYQTELPSEQQIRDWWSVSPGMNVGLITGALSGVVILDVDGEEGLEEIAARGGIERTPQSQSRANRFHFYFRHPGFPTRNFAKKLPGLDFRGDGGYVLLPPSLHSSGDVYHWIVSPGDAEFAPLPDWLLKLLQPEEISGSSFNRSTPAGRTPGLNGHGSLNGHAANNHSANGRSVNGRSAYVQKAFDDELEILRRAAIGEQNDQLNKTAFALGQLVGAGAISQSEVESEVERIVLSWPCQAGQPWTLSNLRPTLQSGLEHGKRQPRILPEEKPAPKLLRGKAAREYIETGREPDAVERESDDEDDEIPIPYAIEKNRIVFVIEKTNRQGETVSSSNIVADFAAHIVEEIATEDDEKIYKIHIRTPYLGERRSTLREVEVTAKQAADGKQLAAILSSVAGAQFPVRAGMEKHLPVALKLLSGDFAAAHRFNRTGWANVDGEELFLIPGREDEAAFEYLTLRLPQKLPYRISGSEPSREYSAEQGILKHLIEAQRPEVSTIALAFALQAPLGRLCGWGNERYCCFIAGRSGSLKTSWTQAMMALYGIEFGLDEKLVKWGEGATRNAIMNLASHAHDLPLVIDNYKPNTGGGARDFVNIVHNILEGGEKDRLTKNLTMRDSRPIWCWPIVTGEDVPESDAASLARVLVVPFTRVSGSGGAQQLANLTAARDGARHLNALGAAWIKWLESEAGEAVVTEKTGVFDARRLHWAGQIRRTQPDVVNPLRLASNLASNELTWKILGACPATAPVVLQYQQSHARGLLEIAGAMATHTATVLEAHTFLETLRELLLTERALLLPFGQTPREDETARMIGYRLSDGSAYLLEKSALRMVAGLIGHEGLNNMSASTLRRQLHESGYIESYSDANLTKVAKDGNNQTKRFLHLKNRAFDEDGLETP